MQEGGRVTRSEAPLTPAALRRVIQRWDTGTGFDDAIAWISKISSMQEG
jgi:hypothetical protein